MKKPFFQQNACVIFVILMVAFGISPSLWATGEGGSPLDLSVKIGKIDEKLRLVEKLIPPNTDAPVKSPVFMAKSMLQGTHWIDPDRLIVLGVIMGEPQPEIAVILPYIEPNLSFQSAYHAMSSENAYIISLPPGNRSEDVSETMQQALVDASKSGYRHFLSLELAVKALLTKADDKIRKAIDKIGETQTQDTPQGIPLSPQEMKETLNNLVDIFRQLETVSEGIDIDNDVIRFVFSARAVENSELAGLFGRGEMLTLLDNYKPDKQVNFRSGRYDYQGVISLMDKLFGTVYAKMGIDFKSLSDIMTHFTGEMAGGMDFSEDKIQLEMISVLKKESRGVDFLEGEYLPWLEKYMQTVTAEMEKQTGGKGLNVFTRTPDSTVAGRKVYGVKLEIPFMAGGLQDAEKPESYITLQYEIRLARDGDFFIIAPDDDRMAELLVMTSDFKEDVNPGPLFTMEMDWGGYFSAISRMAGISVDAGDFPKTAKMTFMADMDNGRVDAVSSVRLSDIQNLIAYSKKMAEINIPARKRAGVVSSKSAEPVPEKQKRVVVEDAAYWMDRGALCAMYGNDAAAVKYFEKALELEPEKGDAHFLMAMSYEGLGNTEKALEAVNMAISLDGENATYLYGRGRIYLLSNKKEQALSDFRIAADKGNEDAKRYLIQEGLYSVY